MLELKNKHTFSDYCYVLRGLAIISVAYAHSLTLSTPYLQRIGAILGLAGVPLFLVLSGLWFKESSWRQLIDKLIRDIGMPWLIWGTFGYIISLFLGAVKCGVLSYVAFICGHGTWLYYLLVYVVIRLIFNKLNRGGYLLAFILISLVSSVLSYYNQVYCNTVGQFITPWQNPLNWLGFFAIGIIIKRHNLIRRVQEMQLFVKASIFVLPLAPATMLACVSSKINYWNPLAIAFEYSVISGAFVIAMYCYKSKLLKVLGENSLLLYLLHIQLGIAIANIVYKALNLPEFIILLTKPLVVLLITMLFIATIKKAINMFRLSKYSHLFGIYTDKKA